MDLSFFLYNFNQIIQTDFSYILIIQVFHSEKETENND